MCKLVISKHFSKWNRKNALVQECNLSWEGWGSSQNNSDSWEASCWTCFNLNTYPSQTEMIDCFFFNRILALKPFSLLKEVSKAQIKARPQCQRPEFPPPTPDVPSTHFQTPEFCFSRGRNTPALGAADTIHAVSWPGSSLSAEAGEGETGSGCNASTDPSLTRARGHTQPRRSGSRAEKCPPAAPSQTLLPSITIWLSQNYSQTTGICSRAENRANTKRIGVSQRTLGIPTHSNKYLKPQRYGFLQTGLKFVHQGNAVLFGWHRSPHSMWRKSSQEAFMIHSCSN